MTLIKIAFALSIFSLGLAFPQDPSVQDDDGHPPLPQDPPIQNHPFLIPNNGREWNQPDEEGNYQLDDMILNEVQFKHNFGTDEEKAELDRQGIPGSGFRWPNGKIPFVFSSEVSTSNRNTINSVINSFNSVMSGCIEIKARSSESDYVLVTGQNTGCWSQVGRRGGQQELNLQQNGCISSRTIQHEFIHALGMYHMQSRADRDQYVTVNFNNIQSGKEHNFQLLSDTLTFNTEYNARSFMHYPYWAFAIDNSIPTISSKINSIPTSELGSSSVLTNTDILNLKRMYGCDESGTTTTTQASSCQYPHWKGDNYCDDGNNNAGCDYDGGDCCGNVNTQYCSVCQCLDPNFTTAAPSTTTTQASSCQYPFWKGDNYCDDGNNNAGCDYDGGDCCGNVNTTYCNVCACLDPNFCENSYWSDNACTYWASKGYCTHSYVAWMTANCQEACGVC